MPAFFFKRHHKKGEVPADSATTTRRTSKRAPMKKTQLDLAPSRSSSVLTANTDPSSCESDRESYRENTGEPRPFLVRTSSLLRGSSSSFDHGPSSIIDVEQIPHSKAHFHCQAKDDDNKKEKASRKERHFSKLETTHIPVAFTEKDYYSQSHPIETPELIAAKLVQFDNHVATIPKKQRQALTQATLKCPDLLDEKFKLMFLRCEVFHEKRAAKRYVKYWELRLDVFGPKRAFQPLTLEGGLKDDFVALEIGFFRLVPNKDASGRSIITGDPTCQDFTKYTTKSMIRAVWYMFHAALEDEVTQKRGVVFVADLTSANIRLLDHELARTMAVSVTGCIPVRLSGIHGCKPPLLFWAIYPVLKVLMGEKLRKRVMFHSGKSSSLLLEDLAKYGLAQNTIPPELGGRAALDHIKWLEERRFSSL